MWKGENSNNSNLFTYALLSFVEFYIPRLTIIIMKSI